MKNWNFFLKNKFKINFLKKIFWYQTSLRLVEKFTTLENYFGAFLIYRC